MANKKKVSGEHSKAIADYIYKMLNIGHKKEHIKKRLLSVGWLEEVIDEELSKMGIKDDENVLTKEKTKKAKRFFGGLLFIILIIIIVVIVYISLIFNQNLIKINYLGYWLLYIILGLLLLSLIIFLPPLILGIKKLYKKIRKAERLILKEEGRKRGEEERRRKLEEKQRRKAEKLRLKEERKKRLLEKQRRKAEKLRLKEEKRRRKEEEKRRKLLEKERRKAEKLRLKEEKRREKREEKEKRKREKIPLVKELSRSLKIEIGRYETDIDILYKIIEKNGRIKLSAIARYFGVDERKAEEWATILQEHNLADIHYPAIGGPELRRKLSK